ncbi:kynureninase [Ferrimicrobium acidiphilum]|uniref:kynureninase n=1 Tax=Ferrimicrobium acidiphilum TaxID=121039 RepID=UPI0023F5379F|nr:kynureninase [Ferrimicrobium acidiphilum]
MSELSQQIDRLDQEDVLAEFCARFVPDVLGVNYLDGNSLGRLSHDARAAIVSTIDDEWGNELIRGWEHWTELSSQLGETLGSQLLGAAPGQVVVSDSTSVNLYKAILSALSLLPDRKVLVADINDFPTDRFILEGIAASNGLELRLIASSMNEPVGPDEFAPYLDDDDVAVVVMSQVNYRSGALNDLARLAYVTHSVGALLVADLSHSVGAVPIALDADDVDFAVGCTYKYVNGGPGSPAFLYARERLQSELTQPIWGWFSAADQFQMGLRYEPVPGIGRFLVGTPPVLQLAALKGALGVVCDAGIERIRQKSVIQTELAIELFDAHLAPQGFRLASPRDPAKRGGHVTFEHSEALSFSSSLFSDHRVLVDYRVPNRIRFAPSPLYTSFAQVYEGVMALSKLAAR